MRLRNIPKSQEAVDNSPFVVKEAKEKKGSWKKEFGNNNPIHLEVGMGKGRFLTELASLHPEINYVGIERYTSVLFRALQKIEEAPLPNLRFLCVDAAELLEIFEKEEISRIYLNFSDPWPKDRHAKRRLPSREFLSRYDQILKKDGRLEFKTDNRELFDFAVEELKPAGWKTEAVTYDLHSDQAMSKGNVMTEYEEKFSTAGNPIYKYIIYR